MIFETILLVISCGAAGAAVWAAVELARGSARVEVRTGQSHLCFDDHSASFRFL